MMSNVNSIIIEGTVDDTPEVLSATEDNPAVCNFRLTSQGTKHTTIRVETTGRLAELCGEYLKKGRAVRVVGQIASAADGIYIEGVHMEFRPQLPKPAEDKQTWEA